MKYDKIKAEAGLCEAVNPYSPPANEVPPPKSKFWDFETWLSTQPPIFTSAPDGVYNVDEFEPVVWQYEIENEPGFWFTSRDQSHFKGGFNEYTNHMKSIGCVATRQWLELKPAADYTCNCCGISMTEAEIDYTSEHDGSDYCKDCNEAIQSDDESSGRVADEQPDKVGEEKEYTFGADDHKIPDWALHKLHRAHELIEQVSSVMHEDTWLFINNPLEKLLEHNGFNFNEQDI